MKPTEFRLSRWISSNYNSCLHNFSLSGLDEPDLAEMGINTSYGDFKSFEYESYDMFRNAIAGLYGVKPENVLPTIGGSEAIFLVSAYLQEHVKTLHIPVPEYEPMFSSPASLGMNVATERLEEVPASVSSGDAIAFTSPNNPNGRRIGEEKLAEIMDAKKDKNLKIYIDETFNEFGFREKPETMYMPGEGIITSGTMTKFFGIGNLRVGWITADKEIIDQIRKIKDMVTVNNTAYSLWIGSQIIENRERFVKRAKERIPGNGKMVKEYLEGIPRITWSDPDSAPFGYVSYDRKIGSRELAELAMKEKGILISPAEFFGSEYGFRLCFTSPAERLQESMEELTGFLKEVL